MSPRPRAQINGGWLVQIGEGVYGYTGGERAIPPSEFWFAQGHASTIPPLLLEKRVAAGDGFHVFHLPGGPPASLERLMSGAEELCRSFSGELRPLKSGMCLAAERAALSDNAAARGETGLPDADVQALVDQVDPSRYISTIDALNDFGSRNTFNAGNANARAWLVSEFQALGLTVETPLFTVFGDDAYNVVARLEGSLGTDEFLLVGAHYDSLPSSGNAPGAEDNASGTAAVLEVARIMAPVGTQRDVVFIAFSGEEQGLRGSQDYVSDLTPAQRANLQGAIILDMVAYTADAQIDVLLETSSSGFALRSDLAQAAADFTNLTVFASDFPFGSDHVPFLNAGLPSLLLIENDWDVYPCYHQSCDTVFQVSASQGAEIVRMAVATVARLANPQPVPVELSAFSLE
jgi:hypothetical protein